MGAYDTLGPTDWDNLAGRPCLPGLHEITGDVHNEVALRLRDAESA